MDFRSMLGDFALEQADADYRSELESIVNQCDMYIDNIRFGMRSEGVNI